MTATTRRALRIVLAAATLLSPALRAQEKEEPAPPPRPPEGSVVVNLPSADVPREGTLSLLFTHRFSQPLADSDFHSLFSFDSGADIGIGLSYAPVRGLDVGLYRSSNLDVYEFSAKYQVRAGGAFHAAVRGGADLRTEKGLDQTLPGQTSSGYSRRGFFGQAIVSYMFADRVRLTLVPTYVSETSGQPFSTPRPSYTDLFSIPAAVSIRVLRSVNIQGEIYPRLGRADSQGVGWICALEKTVLNHRFAFTVGNVRTTTVDQYVGSVPFGANPHDYFIGFNLVRQWKLK
jgi:uncharacterized beta barrel domain-containing protein DUF5777